MTYPDLLDIGANLTHDSFELDRDAVIGRAREHGVRRMIVTGSSEQGSIDAANLAHAYSGSLYATAGVHPHHASDYGVSAGQTLRELATRPYVVAIGECGLDYFRNFSPRQAQRDAFQAQLELAAECNLPVFLHQRDAHDEFVEILAPMRNRLKGGVAHCFTGTESELRCYLDLDLYIGITGWIGDERRGSHLKSLVTAIPDDRLMLETDSPYLLPRSLKPRPQTRRNEPMYLREVLRVVAESTGRPEQIVATRSTANAERFFSLT
ncbi:MAG: TatD family hydrolase [Woeseia sp.]